MFVLELTYTASLDRIDAALPAHVEWLGRHYADGTFLASGRKVPRDGGVILATGDDRAAIEAVTRTDPFVVEGLVEYTVTEFLATTVAPVLEAHRQRLPA
ncbi:YciI family protein [Streptomyces sp. BE20]|uniref:YciI family protein n=1 Tax=Streptomycetaceae TaxID=2062 RepID=UPI002E7A1BE8|nr:MULTISPECIES: YciI family protein [unclassified Streptomyces]MED7955138.1 YciI family protein [Streptomyces sp. BE303]MEE1824913.1 YciI family protein [Streptomyces sp. BE20]